MRSLGFLVLGLSIVLLALGTACHPAQVPGTSAGTFAVTETLDTNACAGGFDPETPLSYTTEIRVQGNVAFWHRGDTPIASGTYASNGHFHFIAQSDVVAYGADAGPGGPPGCTLRQTETIDGDLALGLADGSVPGDAGVATLDGGPDAGVYSSGFTATDEIQISIAPGSDCSLILATNGGPFSTLPCLTTYQMTATRQ